MDNERPNNPVEDFGNHIKEDPPVNFPEWFSIVKKELCHCTTRNGLKGIFKSGEILPNDGRFPDNYPQSKNSYGRINNLISLFDFKPATEEECDNQLGNWYRFFVNPSKGEQEPVSIVILIDRELLNIEKIIPNRKALEDWKLNKKFDQTIIPYIEAFYPIPIPSGVICGYLIICMVDGREFEYIPDKGPFPGIFDKIDEFEKNHNDVYQEYEQSGPAKLEKALNKSKCD